MKKFLLVIFIFLAGFIFAGANASNCHIFHAETITINQTTDISSSSAFLDYENNINKENLKSFKISTERKNSGNTNPVKTLSFENNNENITFEKQYTLISYQNTEQKFKDIKFKLHPRAP